MAKRSTPAISKDGGDVNPTTVWGEVKVSLRPADYEGITVSLGMSRTCDDTPASRKKVRRAIFTECEEAVLREANKIKRNW